MTTEAIRTEHFLGTLLPHQAQAVTWLLAHPKAVLADDVGLGKTVTTCALIGHVLDRPCRGRVLLALPASLAAQWSGELARFLPGVPVLGDAHAYPGIDSMVDVVSLDKLTANLGFYRARDYRLVVVDELSHLKAGGAQAQAVGELAAAAERVVGLTATPMENDLIETYRMLQACAVPGLPPSTSWERFVVFEAVTTSKGRHRRKPVGVRGALVPELKTLLAPMLLRRTADQVGLDLPTVDEHTYREELTEGQLLAYQAAGDLDDLLARHQARDKATSVVGGRSAKADKVLGLLGLSPKAIVYAHHLEHLDAVEQLLSAVGIGYIRLDGRLTQRQRDDRVAAFRDNPAIRVLLGNEVIERGLNLQFCDHLISLGVEWNPARNAQRVGRIRRIGSPHAQVRHDIVLSTTPSDRRREMTARDRLEDFEMVFGRTALDRPVAALTGPRIRPRPR